MLLYTTVNYSDIYPGPKPIKEKLLEGISSRLLVKILSVINTELSAAEDMNEVQTRMTGFMTQRFSVQEKAILNRGLSFFQNRAKLSPIIWGKRYVLGFIKYEFLNYRDLEQGELTPEHELNIFKAYLLIAEELNEKDGEELKKVTDSMETSDEHFFEKLVWPFLLKQFDINNKVNPSSQFIKLLALIKHGISDSEILKSWKKFINYNGFETLNKYLAGIHYLITVTLRNKDNGSFLRAFTRIKTADLPKHLLNLSFDVDEFMSDDEKKIDFKGLREKPLFRSNDDEFVILDIDYLNNKIYNGPLFDMYYKTNMSANTRFKVFPDFKKHIGTHVSENIIFRGVIGKLFKRRNIEPYFDNKSKPNQPDCYIRNGSTIFLIEFKDYLFPGKLVDEYSFQKIKEHIDLKFIKNERGSNKGISQIIEQLKILSTIKFEFDRFRNKNIKVYPLIVHTNFTYQLPGVNCYLQKEFEKKLVSELPDLKIRVEKLILIDLDTLFEFLYLKEMNLKIFEVFLNRYNHILENRTKKFYLSVSQENFVRARTSFDEIYKTILYKETQTLQGKSIVNILLEAIDANEELLNAF